MCSFHVRQCLHRHLQTAGLTVTFEEDVKLFINHAANRIGGLQHIPIGLMDEAVDFLRTYFIEKVQTETYGTVAQKFLDLLNNYFVPTWIVHHLGLEFFSAFDLTTNRTNNYAEQFHGKQSLYYKKVHPKLGSFMYDDRMLQNHMEEDIRLKEAGERALPEKNEAADLKIARHRRKLIVNLQRTLQPNERSAEILNRLLLLGKYAGMTALL